VTDTWILTMMEDVYSRVDAYEPGACGTSTFGGSCGSYGAAYTAGTTGQSYTAALTSTPPAAYSPYGGSLGTYEAGAGVGAVGEATYGMAPSASNALMEPLTQTSSYLNGSAGVGGLSNGVYGTNGMITTGQTASADVMRRASGGGSQAGGKVVSERIISAAEAQEAYGRNMHLPSEYGRPREVVVRECRQHPSTGFELPGQERREYLRAADGADIEADRAFAFPTAGSFVAEPYKEDGVPAYNPYGPSQKSYPSTSYPTDANYRERSSSPLPRAASPMYDHRAYSNEPVGGQVRANGYTNGCTNGYTNGYGGYTNGYTNGYGGAYGAANGYSPTNGYAMGNVYSRGRPQGTGDTYSGGVMSYGAPPGRSVSPCGGRFDGDPRYGMALPTAEVLPHGFPTAGSFVAEPFAQGAPAVTAPMAAMSRSGSYSPLFGGAEDSGMYGAMTPGMPPCGAVSPSPYGRPMYGGGMGGMPASFQYGGMPGGLGGAGVGGYDLRAAFGGAGGNGYSSPFPPPNKSFVASLDAALAGPPGGLAAYPGYGSDGLAAGAPPSTYAGLGSGGVGNDGATGPLKPNAASKFRVAPPTNTAVGEKPTSRPAPGPPSVDKPPRSKPHPAKKEKRRGCC
jgi:hypothetical protein